MIAISPFMPYPARDGKYSLFFQIYLRKKLRRPIVYLIRKRALGDVLWIEPVIRQLAASNKKVIVFTKYNDLFRNYPLPNVVFRDRLSLFEKLLWKIETFLHTSFFVVSLELAYEKKPAMHMLNAYQEKARLPLTQEYPRLYLSDEERNRPTRPDGKLAVLHLESFTDKNYRKVYGIDWAAVAQHLIDSGYKVVQLGKRPAPIPSVEHIQTSIREMIVLLSKSSLFVGLDSGPSHIAAGLGIPSLVFFGAVNPRYRHFMGLFRGIIMQQPCEYAGCYHDAVNNIYGSTCKLVGDNGIPKCSVHTTAAVNQSITQLITRYVNSAKTEVKN